MKTVLIFARIYTRWRGWCFGVVVTFCDRKWCHESEDGNAEHFGAQYHWMTSL
jgi:hypothetical protein